jgi:hypothetical protein
VSGIRNLRPLDQEEDRRVRWSHVAWIQVESEGGAMATQHLRTLGWNTWTLICLLLILILAVVYFVY